MSAAQTSGQIDRSQLRDHRLDRVGLVEGGNDRDPPQAREPRIDRSVRTCRQVLRHRDRAG